MVVVLLLNLNINWTTKKLSLLLGKEHWIYVDNGEQESEQLSMMSLLPDVRRLPGDANKFGPLGF